MSTAPAIPPSSPVTDPVPTGGERLYQRLAKMLHDQLASGHYAVGDRLPAERELSVAHGVSRPAVREALIALEVQGFVEVRVGSGAFVRRLPGDGDDRPGFAITAFELTEARMVFEGEAAALAALHITDAELAELARLIELIEQPDLPFEAAEAADRAFHLLIAHATRNAAVEMTINQFWQIRTSSPECALLHKKARSANVRPVMDEHSAILIALRTRDPVKSRQAMRAHLNAVMDHLLFATEEQVIENARRSLDSARARYRAVSKV